MPGSGKSFAAKRELLNVFLATSDHIIVVDPMGEYSPLIKRPGGQAIEIAPNSPHHINPLDIRTDNDGEEGLPPVERTVIDRSTRLVYRDFLMHPETAAIPTLQDLHAILYDQPEPEAKRLAIALEIYVSGSLNVNNQTQLKH